MKKIKTVIFPVEDFDIFDKKVNKLLAENWKLICRKIISVKGEPNEVGSTPMVQSLYAEFEKEVCYFEEVTL